MEDTMSRGPGKLQRKIAGIFEAQPKIAISTREIAQIVYGVREPAQHHYHAINRAIQRMPHMGFERRVPMHPKLYGVRRWIRKDIHGPKKNREVEVPDFRLHTDPEANYRPAPKPLRPKAPLEPVNQKIAVMPYLNSGAVTRAQQSREMLL
jgi:hypothetical protein